jgi:hypothetical protein
MRECVLSARYTVQPVRAKSRAMSSAAAARAPVIKTDLAIVPYHLAPFRALLGRQIGLVPDVLPG